MDLQESRYSTALAFFESTLFCRLLEATSAPIAKDKIATTVHGVAPRGFLDPKLALWALLQFLLGSEFLETIVAIFRLAFLTGALLLLLLALIVFASNSSVPGTGLTDQTVGLVAQGTVQLAVVLVPFELKRATSRRTARHVVLLIHGSAQAQAQVTVSIFLRAETGQDVSLGQWDSTFLVVGLDDIGTNHLTG